jgi:hypothetical protein
MSFSDKSDVGLWGFLRFVALLVAWLAVPIGWLTVDLDNDSLMGPQLTEFEQWLWFPGTLVVAALLSVTLFLVARRGRA